MKYPEGLRPLRRQLYLISICRGLVFWYAIEKLFEVHIGLSLPQIVIIGLIAQSTRLVFELPTSIIADRWNRRNIILMSFVAMIVCSLTLGLSNNLIWYIVGSILWGMAYALGSGTYEAFTYDSLAAGGFKKHFRQIYSRMFSLELIALGIVSLVSGPLASAFNLRAPFFVTIAPMIVGLLVLLRSKEPPIERDVNNEVTWIRHLSGSIKVTRRPLLKAVFTMYVSLIGLQTIWYEYYQLVGLDVKLSTALFSVMLSILCLGVVLGTEIARRYDAKLQVITGLWLLFFVTQLLGLRLTNAALVLVNVFLTFIAVGSLRIYMEVFMQHRIESSNRATVLSVASTAGFVVFFLSGLLLSWILPRVGIRLSITLIALPLILLGILDLGHRLTWVRAEGDEL